MLRQELGGSTRQALVTVPVHILVADVKFKPASQDFAAWPLSSRPPPRCGVLARVAAPWPSPQQTRPVD